MRVNKKTLASIFDVDVRTIGGWQSQGMPLESGGGKGVEAQFESSRVIAWYAERDASIENEKLRKEVDDLRAAAESDLVPGTIDYERYRLTRAQADAQELKNARDEGEVLENALFTYIMQRLSPEIVGILEKIPQTLLRKYPEISPSYLDAMKTEIARACKQVATAADTKRWIDDFRRTEGG
ncbi:TPA: terminase small subunit [Salmonella enterica subsp. salamae serovar 28:r:e,n,z15]|nr:terminase small subunit [Salmonella enterica subsp. salamae serovar 28:r:e,n,z15]